MKHNSVFFVTMLLMVVFGGTISQVKQMPDVRMFYTNSNGNANNPVPVNTAPVLKSMNPGEAELERKLQEARSCGNTILAHQIQSQLDNLRGHAQVYLPPMQSAIYEGHTQFEYEPDLNIYMIHNFNLKSHAFGIAPSNSNFPGRMFYLFAQSAQSGGDTIKLMYSTNNGNSWLTDFFGAMPGYTFNNDEMDIEIVYDGTNTWVFGVVGLRDQADSTKKVGFFRRIVGGPSYYGTILNFPGSGAGMNYYNPRITSDNSNYTSTSYVMVLCSMDSLAGGNHFIKQKYVLSAQPFAASPSFNFFQPNGQGGFAWFSNNGTITDSYLATDIAYYKDDGGTGLDRIISVYGNFRGQNNIYIAYLNGYSTLGNYMFINEPNFNKHAKIAFNGGANNRYGMITYNRLYNTTDWDIFGFRTSVGGSAPADWTRDTVDHTYFYSRGCDLVAVRGAVNKFKLTYVSFLYTDPLAIYKSFSGTSWTNGFVFNTPGQADTTFARPRAGYMLSGSDDGVGIWSVLGGHNGYLTKLMLSTTGITLNNEIPSGFSLSQNYPNPFNPVTNIKFSLTSSAEVKLIVYDITGKAAAELVNRQLNAGSYTVDFDASHLASGAYFYRLTAGDFTDVKKMMLIK